MNGQYWQEERRQYSSAYGTPPNDSISSCNSTMMNELQSHPHPQQHTATMVHPSQHHQYHPHMNDMEGSSTSAPVWNAPPAAGYYNAQHMHHHQHMSYHPTAKQNQYTDQPMPPPPYRGHHHGIPGHFIFQPGPPPKSSSTRHGHSQQQYNAAGHYQMAYAPSHVSSSQSHHHYGAPYHCPPPSHQYHHGQMHHPYQYPHPGMPPSSYSFAHSSTQHDVPPQSSHAPEQSQHVMTSLQQPILHDESSTALPSNTMLPPKTPGKTYSTIKKVTPRTILKKKISSSTDGIFSSKMSSSSSTPDNMSSTTTSPTPSISYLNDSCDNTSPPSTDNVVASSSKGSVSFSPQVQYHYPESNSPEQDVIDNKKKGDSDGMIEETRDELSPVDAIFAAGKYTHGPFDIVTAEPCTSHIQHNITTPPYHS